MINNLSSGDYNVTVTDAAGCTDVSMTSVSSSNSPQATATSSDTSCGENNGTVSVTATSGTMPYTYAWSNGGSSASITGLSGGTYTATVTDAAGCISTASTTIEGSTSPIVNTSAMATTCGEDNGTASATATSGVAPYSYAWSTGSSNASLTGLAAGSYTVTATDSEGCTTTSTTSVGDSTSPNVNASATATSCGENNGTATATTTSGTAPYTYAWSTGSTTSMINNLSSGDYNVTVTDAAGCTDVSSTTVTSSNSPQASATSSDTSCGENNGTASVTATSGTAPYSYAWSNGGSSASITGLSGGTYTATVTDAAGCISTASTTVEGSTSPIANTSSMATTCGENNGTATATATSGVAPYTYAWSNGSSIASLTGLTAGSYTVTITDSEGCTSTSTTTVGDSTSPNVTASATATSCGENNGTATASTTSGTAPYTYVWSTGSTTSMINNLSAVDYTVTVTDAAGCTDVSTASVTSSNSPQASATSSDTSCGENNGTASVTATSGTAPYTYTWSNGGSTASITGLSGGTYTATVTDAAGCISTASTTVEGSTSPLANTSAMATSCGEDNGTATATATSGVAPYTYAWSNGSSNASMSGLAAGSYTVTITDSEGCTSTSTTTVGDSTSPNVTTSSTATSCGENNATATASTTSGTAPYTYVWSTGSTTSMLNNLSAGDYTVTVTDAAGCTDVSTASVTSSNSPQANATSTDTSCGENNGTASVTATSGTGPYTYGWSNGGSSASISGLTPGSYTVTVTDAAGCIVTANTTIGSSIEALVTTSATDTTCGEDTGSASATGTSGVAPFTYAWSNGSSNASVTGLAAGSYTVTVTDSEGCTDSSTTTVGDSSSPNVTATATSTSCGENNGTVTASTTSGTAPYTYVWSNGSTTAMLNNLATSDYTVTVTDAAGCTDVFSTTVTSSNSPQVTAASTATSCGENNGTASVTATSGIAPYTYAWSNGGTSASITGLSNGSYTVTVTDAAGCIATATTNVGASTSPIASTSGMATTCGENNGIATASATSGTAPYTYSWSNGSSNASITGLAAGSYTVTITDSEGCTGVSSISINDSNSPIASAISSGTTCGSNNGTATASATSGTAPYTYAWSNGLSGATQSGLSAGAYSVTVTDAAGCTGVATATVTNSNPISANMSSTDTTCAEDNGTATAQGANGTAPYTYVWFNGSNNNSVSGLSTGTYSVTITDAIGCTVVGSTAVEDSSSPTVTTNSTNTTCGENNGGATATGTQGTAPYTYLWSNGSTNQNISNLAAGTYSVTMTDAIGCVATGTSVVSGSMNVVANAISTETTCGMNTGTATASATNGTAPYTYLWSTSATTQTITNLTAGTYTVTVTDAVGCTDAASVVVEGSSNPSIVVGSAPEICGMMDGVVTVSISNGMAPYQVIWSNGSTEETQTGLAGGTYSVTVTDSKGCTATGSIGVEGSITPDGGVINEEGETAIEYCIEGTMDMLTELNLTNEVGTNMTWIITSETGTIQHILDYDGIAGFDFDDQNIGTCLIYHLSYEDIMNLSVGSNISTFSGCYDLSNPITLTKYGLADYSESSLLIDMDMCAADGTTNEANDYSEFTATIDNDSNCATLSVVGGNLYRDNPSINGHSCTEGVDGSVAMCVSSDAGCDYNPSSDKAIKLDIEIVPASNGSSRLTELSFFEKAPEVFSWIDGNAGPNNYPTRFGVRVLKGTEVVFQQSGLTTLREWNERTFTFSGDDFLVTETTTFTVELLAYCIIDNGFPVTAWDIDDLMLVTECDNVIEEGTFTGGPYEICLDGIPDFITDLTLEGAEGAIVKLVLVDESNSIIANFDDLAEFATLDFESLTAGTCTLYAISAGVGFTGCEVGNTLKFDFEGCYKLSNPVTFTKMACGTLVGTYPNPTNSKVTISNMHTMKGDKTVTIYNARGKVVRSYNVSSGIVNDEVDLSEYTAGLYMIQIITTGGHKITKSVMKVKN